MISVKLHVFCTIYHLNLFIQSSKYGMTPCVQIMAKLWGVYAGRVTDSAPSTEFIQVKKVVLNADDNCKVVVAIIIWALERLA